MPLVEVNIFVPVTMNKLSVDDQITLLCGPAAIVRAVHVIPSAEVAQTFVPTATKRELP